MKLKKKSKGEQRLNGKCGYAPQLRVAKPLAPTK